MKVYGKGRAGGLLQGLLLWSVVGVCAAADSRSGEEDARTRIALEPGEFTLVMHEMRVFLQSVQQITAAVAADDMAAAVSAARRSGHVAQHAMPATLRDKLPMPFRQLGMDTHHRFDALALDAEQLGDRDHTLSQLAELLANCVSCHEAYRFEPAR